MMPLPVRGEAVTDAGLLQLRALKNLESLRLNDTDVTENGIEELRKELPDCKISH